MSLRPSSACWPFSCRVAAVIGGLPALATSGLERELVFKQGWVDTRGSGDDETGYCQQGTLRLPTHPGYAT